MPLLTPTQHARLLAQGQRRAQNPAFDPMPVVKLYTPDASVVWLLACADPEAPRKLYGLCDPGTGFPQLGDILLDDLETLRGPSNYPVAVDTHFQARRTLSEYAARAIAHGAYVED